jgi:hypothetical protein
MSKIKEQSKQEILEKNFRKENILTKTKKNTTSLSQNTMENLTI